MNDFTRFIQGNFNNLALLTKLAEEFSNSFDLIIPDYAVCGSMFFSVAHLNLFLALLTDTGQMLFDYDFSGPFDINPCGKPDKEVIQETKKNYAHLIFKTSNMEHINDEEQISLEHYRRLNITNANTDLKTHLSNMTKEIYDEFITAFTNRFINGRNNVLFKKIKNTFPFWSSRRNHTLKGVTQIGDFKVVLQPRNYFVLEKQ